MLNELSCFPDTIIYEAYCLFLDIIYSDGFFHIKEQEKLNEIKELLPFDDSRLAILELSFLEKSKRSLYKENHKKKEGMFYKKGSKAFEKSNKKQKEILLNGSEFVDKIKQISKTAKFDLKFVEEVISESSNRIVKLIDSLENNEVFYMGDLNAHIGEDRYN